MFSSNQHDKTEIRFGQVSKFDDDFNDQANKDGEKRGTYYSQTKKKSKKYQSSKIGTASSDTLENQLNGIGNGLQVSQRADDNYQIPQNQLFLTKNGDSKPKVYQSIPLLNLPSGNGSVSNSGSKSKNQKDLSKSRRQSRMFSPHETSKLIQSYNYYPNQTSREHGSQFERAKQIQTARRKAIQKSEQDQRLSNVKTNQQQRNEQHNNECSKPYELVEIRDGQLILNQDVLQEVFIKHEGNINIVSVVGLPDKGKSSFLNRYLEIPPQQKKFYEREFDYGADGTAQYGQLYQGTEGAILWGLPQYNIHTNTHTFFIDVQGIDNNDLGNLKLQLLILLMSDILVFYSDSVFQDIVKNELTYLRKIEKKFQFPILDQNIQDHMPRIVIIGAEENQPQIDFFSSKQYPQDDELAVSINDMFDIQNDITLDQYLHSLPIQKAKDQKLRKIKKILQSSFKEKYSFIEKVVFKEPNASIDRSQYQYMPDRESSNKKMQVSQATNNSNMLSFPSNKQKINGSVINQSPIQNRLSNQQQPQSQKSTRDVSKSIQLNNLNVAKSQLINIPNQKSFTNLNQQMSQNSGKVNMATTVVNSKICKIEEDPKNDVNFLKNILHLPNIHKKFKNIPINSYTFCKYITLLIEEINQGVYFDPQIVVFKSVNQEFQRITQVVLRDHEQRLHSLVNHDNFQHIYKIMQSLTSIRTSVIEQFNANVFRYSQDDHYKVTYNQYFETLKKNLDIRENQVMQLFKNISYGLNEGKYRTLKTKDFNEKFLTQSNMLQKDNQMKFIDSLQSFCKEYLSFENEIEGIDKVHELGKQFEGFSQNFDQNYQSRQKQIFDKDSHKKLYETFHKRNELLKQKYALFEQLNKTVESETENLKGLEKELDEKYIKQINQQKTYKDHQNIRQKIDQCEDQIKTLKKKYQKYKNELEIKTKGSQFSKNAKKSTASDHVNKTFNSEANITQQNIENNNNNQLNTVNQNKQPLSRLDSLQFNWLMTLFRTVCNSFAFLHF